MLILFLLLINEDTEEQRGEVIWPYHNRQEVAEPDFNSDNLVVDFVLKNKLKNDGESTFYETNSNTDKERFCIQSVTVLSQSSAHRLLSHVVSYWEAKWVQ